MGKPPSLPQHINICLRLQPRPYLLTNHTLSVAHLHSLRQTSQLVGNLPQCSRAQHLALQHSSHLKPTLNENTHEWNIIVDETKCGFAVGHVVVATSLEADTQEAKAF
jgi:hypothetical protein